MIGHRGKGFVNPDMCLRAPCAIKFLPVRADELRMANTAAPAEALVAHVLRRCAISPTAANVSRFVQGSADARAAATAAIDWSLTAAPLSILPASQGRDDWNGAMDGWTSNMRSSNAGMHERMTWFWHGFFATSSEKVGNLSMLHTQQQLLRTHALGNYGTLLRSMLNDPAMMLYLDMAGSSVEAPNENFARELMELFSIGPGMYTEDDVKAGALALAGFEVDYDSGRVTKNAERSLGGDVVFLGRRGRLGVDDIVDVVLAHDACAPTVAAKVYHHLVGVRPSPDRLATIAKVFRSKGYEVRPLVEEIVRGEEFLNARLNRPRFPIEWWVAALAAMGPARAGQDQGVNPWILQSMNQMPHRPPNVAGWPISSRWLASDQQIVRASYVRGMSWRMAPIVAPPGGDLVAATMSRCSLHEVSSKTLGVLRDAALATAGNADEMTISRRLLTAAVCSPEFALA
jgi:uncharacterized protein (DUF1800 family)